MSENIPYHKPLKIFHGPENIGGAGWRISQLERNNGFNSEFVVYEADVLFPNYHKCLHCENHGLLIRYLIKPLLFFFHALFTYDVFHFYFGITLLPLGIDLPFLKLFGKKIVMTYCGSEIRLKKDVESKRNPYIQLIKFNTSPIINRESKYFIIRVLKYFVSFRHDHPKFDIRKKWMMRWHNMWIDRFFACRDLYANARKVISEKKIIGDVWLNNVLPDEYYHINQSSPVVSNDIPIIIHIPTNEWSKGTYYIENALNALEKKGIKFQYKRLKYIPNEQLIEILSNECDILIDQVLCGSFGSLSVEAMHCGKPVVCYMLPEIIEQFCPDCPIWNANIDNLEERLTEIITNKELRIELGKRGREFVKKYLDVDKIGKQIADVYSELKP